MDGTIILLCFSKNHKFTVKLSTHSTFNDIFEKVRVKSRMESDGIDLTFSVGSLVDVTIESDEDAEIMFSHAIQARSEIIEIKVVPRKQRMVNLDVADGNLNSSSDESEDDIDECLSDDNIIPEGVESEEDDGSDYLDRFCRHNDRFLKTERWKNAQLRWLARFFTMEVTTSDEIIDQFNRKPVISPRDVVNEFRKDYGMEISYMKVWRGVQEAKLKHYGMHASTYTQLIGLIQPTIALKQGTEMFIEFDNENQRFQRFFVAYGPCLQGFKYCRPLLFLDGTFLKSRYKGTLLIATAKDANQGIYPIAFAVVDSETIDNWSWFLDSLSKCISRDSPITFISDRNKGILEAVTKIFPESPHGFCMIHLRANLREKLGGTPREVKKRILALLWKAAQTPYKDECIKFVAEMSESNDKVRDFLSNAPLENWTNSHFIGNRYGELYSNAAESVNSWIRNERNLPVKNMVDDIRRKIMTKMAVRRKLAKNVTTILCPKFLTWYEKDDEKGRAWLVHQSDDNIYEVMSSPSHVVNIQERICSCLKWQIRGFPCSHAITAILKTGKNTMEFVEDYCKADFWYKAHEVPILPNPSISQQVTQIGELQLNPPITRVPPGRP